MTIRTIISALAGLALVMILALPAEASITYTSTDLGSDNWLYEYTVTNDFGLSNFFEFTIFFPTIQDLDALNYSNLSVVSTPAHWSSIVAQPSAIDLGGYFDSLADSAFAANAVVSGFSVQYHYVGNMVLGSQYYELYDDSFNVIGNGFTTPTTPSTTPEPGSITVLGIGLVGLFIRHGRRARHLWLN